MKPSDELIEASALEHNNDGLATCHLLRIEYAKCTSGPSSKLKARKIVGEWWNTTPDEWCRSNNNAPTNEELETVSRTIDIAIPVTWYKRGSISRKRFWRSIGYSPSNYVIRRNRNLRVILMMGAIYKKRLFVDCDSAQELEFQAWICDTGARYMLMTLSIWKIASRSPWIKATGDRDRHLGWLSCNLLPERRTYALLFRN